MPIKTLIQSQDSEGCVYKLYSSLFNTLSWIEFKFFFVYIENKIIYLIHLLYNCGYKIVKKIKIKIK